MGMKLKNYVAVSGYTDFFKQPMPEDRLYYLREYPTDLLLLRLSKVNALLFQERNNENLDLEILQNAIFEDGLDKLRFKEFAEIYQGRTRLFAAPPLTMLITACLQNFKSCPPDQPINTLNFARNLFKTIVLCGYHLTH